MRGRFLVSIPEPKGCPPEKRTVIRNMTVKWENPGKAWSEAALEFAIHYGERFHATPARPS